MAELLRVAQVTTSAASVDLHQQAARTGHQLRHTALTTEAARVLRGAQLRLTAHRATVVLRARVTAIRIALQAQAAGRQVRRIAHRAMAAHTAQVIQVIQIVASNKYNI